MTRVIIERDMPVVFSLADRVTVMAQGRIIAGGAADAVRGDRNLRKACRGGAHR